MYTSIDFINSISIIGFSDMKNRFEIYDDLDPRRKYLLDLINADKNRIYFNDKMNNQNNRPLMDLAANYNASLKEGEKRLDLERISLKAEVQINYRKKFGDFPKRVLLSLPKENYIEMRLLCGATLNEIEEEVKGDVYNTARIEEFRKQWNVMRMFPVREEQKSDYENLRFETKKRKDGTLYNSVLDMYGREIGELIKVQEKDSLRDTYNIVLKYPKDLAVRIKETLGEEKIEFSSIEVFSEILNDHFTTLSTKEEETEVSATDDSEDEVVRDNTSNTTDAEYEVAQTYNGPFESTAPIAVDLPEDERILDNINTQNLEDNGKGKDNKLEAAGLFAGDAQSPEKGKDDNKSGVQQGGKPADNSREPSGSNNGDGGTGRSGQDQSGDKVDDSGNQVGSDGMGVGRHGDKDRKPSGENNGSRTGGSDNKAAVHSDSRTATKPASEPQPEVVSGGSDPLHRDTKQTDGEDAGYPGSIDGIGNDNRGSEEPVIYNTDAYIDSEHNVDIPKAGTAEAYNANIEAIQTLTSIIRRGTLDVSDDEKEKLKKYTGFGGQTTRFLQQHSRFLEYNVRTTDERVDSTFDSYLVELCKALAEADTNSSLGLYGINKQTTIRNRSVDWSQYEENARQLANTLVLAGTFDYYTPKLVTNLQKTIFQELGIKGGSYKEPSAGTGNMTLALDRETISKFDITSIEMNVITGLINKCLNPSSNVIISQTEHTSTSPSDVTVTNCPFSENVSVSDKKFLSNPDKRYTKATGSLTGYFPLKMIEETKPGGIIVCLNTSGFMDNYRHTSTRELMAEKANLIGAIRLPEGIFPDTKVNTDLLIFQKLGKKAPKLLFNNSFAKTTDQKLNTTEYRLNEYFAAHPEYILGEPVVTSGVKGQEVVKYQSDLSHPEDIAQKAEEMIRKMVSDYKQQTKQQHVEASTSVTDNVAKPVQKTLFGDVEDSESELMTAYKQLKEAYNRLIQADLSGTDPNAENLRKDLNNIYDGFVAKYGNLNSSSVKKELLKDQPDCLKIFALENVDVKENLITQKKSISYKKCDIFDHCTINPAKKESDSNSPKDVVFFSFATTGKIDPTLLKEKFGDNWFDQCKDYIYLNPRNEEYELSNIYLSQNIGDKLEEAKNAALYDKRYERNVKALQAALPPRIGIDDITVNMGSDLADVDTYVDFITIDCINVESSWDRSKINVKLDYDEANHSYKVDFNAKTKGFLRGYDVREDCRAKKIFEAALNDTHIKVYDRLADDTRVVNQSLTLIANAKVKEIRDRFEDWIHVRAPKMIMDKVEENFNRRFNQYKETDWSDMQLNIVGSTVVPREHQRAVIARGLVNDDMLMHHAVGAGKTLAMAMTMMERVRLGIAHKCCLLTLKANAAQIATEIQAAYPSAKILFPSGKDFDANNRNIFLNKIKHTDADIVILTHDQFNKIKHTDYYRDQFVKWQMDAIVEIKKYADEGGLLTPEQLKKIQQRERNIQNRVDNDNEKLTKDDISWSELGFDNLAVDEAHVFKNLMFTTNHNNVKGINPNSDSLRSMHLFMAVREIQDKCGGDKGVIFATGTPLSNSLAEMYNLQVYLTPTILRRQGITCFDKWADVFAQRQMDWEPDELGTPKLVERFRSFVNLQSLLTAYKGFADIVSEKDLLERKLVPNKPRANYQQVIVPFVNEVDGLLFDELKSIMETSQSSLLNVDLKDGESSSAKNLVVLGLGSKAAITPKLLGIATDEMDTIHTKVDYVCKNVARIYKETSKQLGTQLIFSDLFQTGEKAEQDYNLYKDIKKFLVEKYNIPAKEIVAIGDVPEKKKEEFFQSVNDGKVRIVLGSTAKLGTGVNVQRLACAAHMVDVNWTPSGMIQKTGRVARQGNLFAQQFLDNQVPVFLYVKEKSTDAKKYGLVFARQRMIEQITDKDFKGNRYDEGKSETELESDIFQEMLASATGDNTTMVKNKLEKQYGLLMLEKKGHESANNNLNRNIQNNEIIRKHYQDRLRHVDILIEEMEKNGFVKNEDKYPFKVTYDGKEYTSPKELGNQMIFDVAMAIDHKRAISKELSSFGLTAQLQGDNNSGFVVKMTRFQFAKLDENFVKELNLSRQIDKNNLTGDIESVGRYMNQLLLAVKNGKTNIESKLSEIDFAIKNLRIQSTQSAEFPKEREMQQMRSDIKLLEKTLKGNDLDTDVNNALINLDNALKSDYSRDKMFIVRCGDKLKIYLSDDTDKESFSKVTKQKVVKDEISKKNVSIVTGDSALKDVIAFCSNSGKELVYVNNFREVMDMDVFEMSKVQMIDYFSSSKIDKIKPMIEKGQKDDEAYNEYAKTRLAELRNTGNKETKEEETEEFKQMKTNVITWKELGFPDPKDENPDLSKVYSLDNITAAPIIKNKKDYPDDLAGKAVMEEQFEYEKPNKETDMEEQIKKNDLRDALTRLQKTVSAQQTGIDMIESKIEVRGSSFEDEELLKDSYEEVKKIKKEVEDYIEKCKPLSKDEDYKDFIDYFEKLKTKIEGIESSLSAQFPEEKVENKVSDSVKKAVENVAKIVKENEKRMDQEFDKAKKWTESAATIATDLKTVEPKPHHTKEEPKKQNEVTVKNPAQTIVGYGQLGSVVNTKGETVTSNLPKIRVQIDLKSIEEKMDKMNVLTKKDGTQLLNFAIIRNKKAQENQSPYIVIAKRQGLPATVNGKEVKFSDTAAILEFSVNLKELKEKAQKAGVDMNEGKIPLSVGMYSGKTGVKINDNSKLVTKKNLDGTEYELSMGRFSFVNQFDRIIKTKLNLDDSLPKQLQYTNKYLGDGLSTNKKVADKNCTDIYFVLSKKAILELPEADAFGNIKIAICSKRTDSKYLQENNLTLNPAGYPVNEKGERVANFNIVADPKTYKDGQPYESTKMVITVRKDDLLKYPVLNSADNKNNKSNDIALKFDGFTNRIELNVSKYIARNQTEDVNKYIQQKTGKEFAHDKNNPYATNKETIIDSKYEPYKESIAKQEAMMWNSIKGKPETEEWKKLPTQWNVFDIIVSELKAKQAKNLYDSLKNDNKNDFLQDQSQDQSKGKKI